MQITKRISMALALAALAAGSAQAQAPASNQQTADTVAQAIRSNPTLANTSQIAIEARGGVVTLSGVVANSLNRAEAVARARAVHGVLAVNDRLSIPGDDVIRTAGLGHGHGHGHGGMVSSPISADGGYGGGGYVDGGVAGGAAGGAFGGAFEGGPMPEGPAGMAGGTQASQPGMPNYAWPSYAPYPNFSAVGYPTVYPWQAWPNIGPFYPYPEVPLDWRAVTLRWDDGLWWLDFRKHYTRPFFTPYPFGIFGY